MAKGDKGIIKGLIVGFIGAIIVGKGILFLSGNSESASETANILAFVAFIALTYAVIKSDSRKE